MSILASSTRQQARPWHSSARPRSHSLMRIQGDSLLRLARHLNSALCRLCSAHLRPLWARDLGSARGGVNAAKRRALFNRLLPPLLTRSCGWRCPSA